MDIHAFFILKKNGISIYHRNFSKKIKYNIDLVSPFFSAIFDFSQEVVSRSLEILEMDDLRFVFKVSKDYIFVLLSDKNVSLLFLKSSLNKLSKAFNNLYVEPKSMKELQEVDNPEFDEQLIVILSGRDIQSKFKSFYEELANFFREYMMKGEILGAAVLSNDGNVLYSTLPKKLLTQSIKELELRFMMGTLKLPEFYYKLENGQKIFSKAMNISDELDDLLMVLLFGNDKTLGVADLTLNNISETIMQLL